MSQLLAQKRRRLGDDDDTSEESDEEVQTERRINAGYIRRLTLKNFMCHDHFELDFGPHMNFIIGRNGSGKSAILTGLSVGLGAKAMDTNRGSSIRSLIKDGKSIARIIVVFDNNGYDPFEKNVYGSTITIERKLSREGTNSYYIRSENGQIISTKKKTVDEILQKFFVIVNNPLSFLSQDKAREFIASSTEQSRFTYFSEGTNIQTILLNYQDASRNILDLQQRLKTAREFLYDACQRYKDCERTYQKYKHSHNLREQAERINGKMYWFNVEVMERRLNKKNEEKAQKHKEIEDLHAAAEMKKQLVTNLESKLALQAGEFEAVREELEVKKADVLKAEVDANEASLQTQQFRNDLKSYKEEVDEFRRQIADCELQIEKEQKKIDEINGGSKEEMKEKLRKLQELSKRLVTERDEALIALSELGEDNLEENEILKRLQDIRQQKSNLQEKIRSMERTKNDKYAAFGLNIQSLLKGIDEETRWHSKPIGPVGCYVSVKEKFSRWADLINAFLQRTLDSFIVCDEHDRRLLLDLMRLRRSHKGIIVRNFEEFQFSSVRVPEAVNVLDALEIQMKDVLYTIIDSTNIEEMLLCDTIGEAENYTRILEVKSAYCLNDKKTGIRLARARGGGIVRDPIFYSSDLRKLAGKAVDIDLRGDLDDLVQEESRLHLDRTRVREDWRQKRSKIQQRVSDVRSRLKDVQNRIFSTERIISEEGDYGRIQSLKLQIENLKNQIEARQSMYTEVAENGKEAKRLEKSKRGILENLLSERKVIEDQVTAFEHNFESMRQSIENSKADLDSCLIRIEEAKLFVENLELKIAEDEKKHLELMSEALSHCSREEAAISESDTTESITTEYVNIQNAIAEAEKSNQKSFEQILDELLEARAEKNKCENSLKELDNARITLENDLNARFENLNITIKEKLARAKLSFEHCLALRGFKGKLEFDFAKKRVLTEVQTKDDKESRAVQSLSGGEKSFTQIAFLLSIWKVMKPRICGLDEFDVFMDSINRTIAIRLLIHELRSSNAQSIFITPQDITAVGDLKDSEDVKIHQIHPPRLEH